MAGRSVSPPPTRFGAVAVQPLAGNVHRTSRSPVAPPATRFAAGSGVQQPIQRNVPGRVPPPPTRFAAAAVVQREPATTTIVAGAMVVAAGIYGFGRYMKWWGGAAPPVGGGGQGGGGPPSTSFTTTTPSTASTTAAPSASPAATTSSKSSAEAEKAAAAAAAAEKNRLKQLAERDKRKAETKEKADRDAKAKAEKEAARREKNEKQREIEEARAKINREKEAERERAEQIRLAAIDEVVREFIAAHLDATVAGQIGIDAKEHNRTVERARTDLQGALTRQRDPPLDRWRFALGMNQAPNNYALLHANAAGQAFEQHGGERIHVTFDRDSIARAPGPITGRSAEDLTTRLLTSPARERRIHATLENQAPANHFFYGDVAGGDRPDKQALKAVLDAYIASDIRPRVQRAIDREGDI